MLLSHIFDLTFLIVNQGSGDLPASSKFLKVHHHHTNIIDHQTMSEEAATTSPAKEEEQPASKKVKTGTMEQSPDSEWPEAWVMPEGDIEDQKALNKQEPNVPFTVEQLKDLGIWYVHSLSQSSPCKHIFMQAVYAVVCICLASVLWCI